jgi:hypothetical protein
MSKQREVVIFDRSEWNAAEEALCLYVEAVAEGQQHKPEEFADLVKALFDAARSVRVVPA